MKTIVGVGMIKSPKAGAAAAKAGHEFEEDFKEYISTYDTAKLTDKNLVKVVAMILAAKNISLSEVKTLSIKKPKKNTSKADSIMSLTLNTGKITEFGISVKKGSESTVSFNNQTLSNFVGHFQAAAPLAYQAFEKMLGLTNWKAQWEQDYGHEVRPSACYLLKELSIEERVSLLNLCSDKSFITHALQSALCGFGEENAEVLIFPRVSQSLKAKDLIVSNCEQLIAHLMKLYDSHTVVQNIDPISPAQPGSRLKNDTPNTVRFFNGLFHLQRKGSGGDSQTNIQASFNLKLLEQHTKLLQKKQNQSTSGQFTATNKNKFRSQLAVYLKDSGITLEDYLVRSSPDTNELFKQGLEVFWNNNSHKFDFAQCDKMAVFEALSFMLGTNGYTPLDAFQNKKTENFTVATLSKLKHLEFKHLIGGYKNQLLKFFDCNLSIFLDCAIFQSRGRNLKGIIYNSTAYGKTGKVCPVVLTKEQFLLEAKNLYWEARSSQSGKSLNLGICVFKRYDGGGTSAPEIVRSQFILAFTKGNSLSSKYFMKNIVESELEKPMPLVDSVIRDKTDSIKKIEITELLASAMKNLREHHAKISQSQEAQLLLPQYPVHHGNYYVPFNKSYVSHRSPC